MFCYVLLHVWLQWFRIGINFGNMPINLWTLIFHGGLAGELMFKFFSKVDSLRFRWELCCYRIWEPCVHVTFPALFGLYFVFTIVLAVITGSWISIPFLLLFMVGFLYVGGLSFYQRR